MKNFKLKITIILFSASAILPISSAIIHQVPDLQSVNVEGTCFIDIDDTAILKRGKIISVMPGIRKLLDKAPISMGVTARMPEKKVIEVTSETLKGLGLEFKSPFSKDLEFVVWCGFAAGIKKVFYSANVLYCGRCPKGLAVATLYKLQNIEIPSNVTVCDDIADNIKSMQDALFNKRSNRFTGYHVQHPDAQSIKFARRTRSH